MISRRTRSDRRLRQACAAPLARVRRRVAVALGLAAVMVASPAGATSFDGAATQAGAVGWAYGTGTTLQLWAFHPDRTATAIGPPLTQRQSSPRGVAIRQAADGTATVVYSTCGSGPFDCDLYSLPLAGGRPHRLGLSSRQWSEVAVGAQGRWLAVGRTHRTGHRAPQLVVYADGRPVLKQRAADLLAGSSADGAVPERVIATASGVVWSLWSTTGCSTADATYRKWFLVRTDPAQQASRVVVARPCAPAATSPTSELSLLAPAGDGVLVGTTLSTVDAERCLVTLGADGAAQAVGAFPNPGTVGGTGGREGEPGDAAFFVDGARVVISRWLQGHGLDGVPPHPPHADTIPAPLSTALVPVASAGGQLRDCAAALLAPARAG